MATQMKMEQMMTSVGDAFRQLITTEKGESLDEQLYPRSTEGVVKRLHKPLDPQEVNPTTISNILLMRAVEMQHWMDYHAYAMMVSDEELKSLLTKVAIAEHNHVLELQSLLPTPAVPARGISRFGD